MVKGLKCCEVRSAKCPACGRSFDVCFMECESIVDMYIGHSAGRPSSSLRSDKGVGVVAGMGFTRVQQ